MSHDPPRFRFTLRDLIVVVAILCVLCALSTILISAWRENSRQARCLNNLKSLGLGCRQHASSQREYPLATNYRLGLVVPGKNDPGIPSAMEFSSGSSWVFAIMLIEENEYLFSDTMDSRFFQVGSYPIRCRVSNGGAWIWEDDRISIALARCPSFDGGTHCSRAHSSFRYHDAAPAITNYLATVGTHFDPSRRSGVMQNGVLAATDRYAASYHLNGIRDGELGSQGNTLLFCESRELTWASWYDGSTAWIVGQPDSSAVVYDPNTRKFLNAENALNYGPSAAEPDRAYCRQGGPYFGLMRRWGPSSLHQGGVVGVAFADGHAKFLSPNIDPAVWLSLIARDDGGPTDAEEY